MFVDGTEIYKFKAKDSEIVAAPLSLENISKDWSVDNKKKTSGYVYDFGVDYDANDVDDILKIHIYLMKKSSIVRIKMFGFVKEVFFAGLTFTRANSLSCISIKNQECKTRPQVVNVKTIK